MPETIEMNKLMKQYDGVHSVPVGIYKDSLDIAYYDFNRKVSTVISSNEFETMNKFIKNFVNALSFAGKTFTPIVLDATNFFETFEYKMSYANDRFNEFVDKLTENNNAIQEILTQNNMNYRSIKNLPNTLVMVIGFEKFYKKLDDDHKKALQKIMTDNKEESKINFVFIDIPSAFKKYEYEEWYKSCMETTNGIWVGPGLGQQFVLKVTTSLSSYSAISKEYGININNGASHIAKLINEIK